MYGTLLVSRDERFRELMPRFVPRIDRNIDLHVANGKEAAMAALNGDRALEIVVFDHDGDNDVREFLDLASRSRLDVPVIVVAKQTDAELTADLVNRHVDGFVRRGERELTEFFTELCNTIVITVERRRNEDEHRTTERRLEAMIQMAKMDQSEFQKVVEFALEKSLEVTGSEIGYVSSFDRERNVLRMMAWSHSAMRSCAVSNYPIEFDLNTTGIWGDPIRLGRTVTVNDYENNNRAMKKGTPAGHVRLRRLLMVPIMLDGKIIGTAGVGNKPSEYTWSDEKQLKMMMQDLFEIHAKIESSRRRSFHLDLISRFIDTGPMGMIFVDSDLDVILINSTARMIVGAEQMPDHFRLDGLRTTQAEDIIEHINDVRKSGSPLRSRILITEQKMNLTYEVFIQMSPIDDGRTGFMVLFNDISDLMQVDLDYSRANEHISVLEGPVLRVLMSASENMEVPSTSLGYLLKIRRATAFMDDYRTAGKGRPMWMKLNSIIEKATHAVSLGDVQLVVKDLGIQVLADQSFHLVFKQLFRNSLVHGGNVTRIEVRCRITRGNMTIVYEDDGVGISDDVRERMSDMESEGRFGMFLVKTIVESSNMSLRCSTPRTGTMFEIDVPPENYSLE